MIAIPAVDLREGACVQLVGGAYEDERVRLEDPVAVARGWVERGFTRLHLVDLDAATGRGDNAAVIARILEACPVPTQVGGGVRDASGIDRLVDRGATWVVVGTRAVEDRSWLAEQARRHPDRLIVAADVRGRQVVTRGWQSTSGLEVGALVRELDVLPLGGILVTAVHREGKLQGTDLPLMQEVAGATRLPVLASGGIASVDDLRALSERGVAGAVLGMALYTGALDAGQVARELCR